MDETSDDLSRDEQAKDTHKYSTHWIWYELKQVDQQENQSLELEEECLKTKHATEIKKVIGSTAELTQFDDLRYRLKSTKNISDRDIKNFFINSNYLYNEKGPN